MDWSIDSRSRGLPSEWVTEDRGEKWRQLSAHLPPNNAVRFV